MDLATKLKRCAALKKRVEQKAVVEESRRRSTALMLCRERVVKRAREEPTFRSLSAGEDEGVEYELQEEAAVVYRSVNNTTMLPEAPLEVSDIDRNMVAMFKMLLKEPTNEEETEGHWAIAMTFDKTVSELRNKMDDMVLHNMDVAFKKEIVAKGTEPVAWVIAKGFDQSAKYMIAEAKKTEMELLQDAFGNFVDKEKALVAAAQASEANQPSNLCHNDSCVVCFESMPIGNILAPESGWTILTCKHGFCTDCLGLWEQSGGCACPICRKPIHAAASSGHSSWAAAGIGTLIDDEEHPPFFRTALDDEEHPPFFRTALNSHSVNSPSDDENDSVVYRSHYDENDSIVYSSLSN